MSARHLQVFTWFITRDKSLSKKCHGSKDKMLICANQPYLKLKTKPETLILNQYRWLSTSVHSPVCNIPTRERNAHDNMPEGSHFKKMIVAMRVSSNRSQMTSKCSTNKNVTQEWYPSVSPSSYHMFCVFVIFYWTAIRQHGIQLLEKTKKNVYDVILIDHS